MAVWLTCPSVRQGPFARPYADMDFAVTASASKRARTFLEAEGYVPDQFFNRLHGATRLYYGAASGGWSVDVIIDQLVMSHGSISERGSRGRDRPFRWRTCS